MRLCRPKHGSTRSELGFTLVELMMVTVIIALLAALAIPKFQEVLIRAHVNSVVADGRILYAGFHEFYGQNLMFPNATSQPAFNLQTFEPLLSLGGYQGNMGDRLRNGQADAYDSPDDQGSNQEFWVVLTLRIDPTYQVVVASSDDAPLANGAWLDGVYTFKDGVPVGGPDIPSGD